MLREGAHVMGVFLYNIKVICHSGKLERTKIVAEKIQLNLKEQIYLYQFLNLVYSRFGQLPKELIIEKNSLIDDSARSFKKLPYIEIVVLK